MKDVRELVKVKPLEWVLEHGVIWRARFGDDEYAAYKANERRFEAYTTLNDAPSVNSVFFGGIEDAKSACNQHHESRIYALLEPK